MLDTVLKVYKKDINTQNEKGETPLVFAGGDNFIYQKVLESGGDMNIATYEGVFTMRRYSSQLSKPVCSVRDIKNAYTGCGINEFVCSNFQCISLAKRCDRNDDCRDKSDERDCGPFNTAPWKNGTIPFKFMNNSSYGKSYTEKEKEIVRHQMKKLEDQLDKGCVKFFEIETDENTAYPHILKIQKKEEKKCYGTIGYSSYP